MICPNCNNATLIVKNNNYFCTSCNIYIGSVKDYHPVASNFILDPPIKESKVEEINYSIMKYIVPIFTAIFIIGLFYILPNFFHYLSFSPYCNIKIEGKSEDFNSNVYSALNAIKDKNGSEYQNICKNIKTIVERKCPVSDERGSGGTTMTYKNNCFVKGSKTIYLDKDAVSSLEETANFSQD